MGMTRLLGIVTSLATVVMGRASDSLGLGLIITGIRKRKKIHKVITPLVTSVINLISGILLNITSVIE